MKSEGLPDFYIVSPVLQLRNDFSQKCGHHPKVDFQDSWLILSSYHLHESAMKGKSTQVLEHPWFGQPGKCTLLSCIERCSD